ncbi:MAG: TonB-dependent receptor plug domain-containing protein [Chloroflexia bacterium]|nr:TonB-dependent receptor plug domain-containing protein [Chloroflexia bacterium]
MIQTSSPDIINALQGKAAGIQITQNSGLSGSDYQVKIRGVHSINSGNDPLWIIDGIPASANALNPSDIESIDILKMHLQLRFMDLVDQMVW